MAIGSIPLYKELGHEVVLVNNQLGAEAPYSNSDREEDVRRNTHVDDVRLPPSGVPERGATEPDAAIRIFDEMPEDPHSAEFPRSKAANGDTVGNLATGISGESGTDDRNVVSRAHEGLRDRAGAGVLPVADVLDQHQN